MRGQARRKEAVGGCGTGFTLVELLIVIVLLGILIAIVVPQLAQDTNDARLASLDANLVQLRAAIERYYQEHHEAYPGTTDAVSGRKPASDPTSAFVQQLTRYTDANGVVSSARTDVFRFGPYLRSSALPPNPYTGDNSVVADLGSRSVTAAIWDGTTAWKFAVNTGRFVANDDPKHAQR